MRSVSLVPQKASHHHLWAKRLLLVLLIMAVVGGFGLAQGCARSCAKDADCDGNLRCGPGKLCIMRCFIGETNACTSGHVCDADGTRCVPGNASADAAPVDNAPNDATPPTDTTSADTNP